MRNLLAASWLQGLRQLLQLDAVVVPCGHLHYELDVLSCGSATNGFILSGGYRRASC